MKLTDEGPCTGIYIVGVNGKQDEPVYSTLTQIILNHHFPPPPSGHPQPTPAPPLHTEHTLFWVFPECAFTIADDAEWSKPKPVSFFKTNMEYMNCFNGIPENYAYQWVMKNGSAPSSSLVLDNEKGELVRAMTRPGQKEVNAEKALLALRNHSEAERRRRERINAHLTTLRSLIPGTHKMDKAALLSEVINHVKKVRKDAAEATKDILVPSDIDEVRVEQDTDGVGGVSSTIRALLCCDYNHELLSDLRLALQGLPVKTVRAEIATIGNRMVSNFEIIGCHQGSAVAAGSCKLLVDSVRQAFKSVLDKFYASEEFLSRNPLSSKRRRVSCFSSISSSPSVENYW